MFNLTLTAANTLSFATTTIEASLAAYDWTRKHASIGLQYTRLGLSQSWLYARLTYKALTSKEAIAFYNFCWNLAQLAFYACKWAIEVAQSNMDNYVQSCQVGAENHEELRDFDAKLQAPVPAPVEVEISADVDALVAEAIAKDVAEEEASQPAPEAPVYSGMGLRQLRVICTQKGFKGAARWNKARCLEALTA